MIRHIYIISYDKIQAINDRIKLENPTQSK